MDSRTLLDSRAACSAPLLNYERRLWFQPGRGRRVRARARVPMDRLRESAIAPARSICYARLLRAPASGLATCPCGRASVFYFFMHTGGAATPVPGGLHPMFVRGTLGYQVLAQSARNLSLGRYPGKVFARGEFHASQPFEQ